MSASNAQAIGFPPSLLGDAPLRLPVLGSREGLLLYNKPAGVLAEAHPWYPGFPSVIAGIRHQLRQAKPELIRLGFEEPYSVGHVDYAASGLGMLAMNKAAAAHWRDCHGSRLLAADFFILVAPGAEPGFLECDQPLVTDGATGLAEINPRQGKKAHTRFYRMGHSGPGELWFATSTFIRPGQIPAHARASGLTLLGTDLFRRKKTETPAVAADSDREQGIMPLLHAFQIRHLVREADFGGGATLAEAPLPKSWLVILRRWCRRDGFRLAAEPTPMAGPHEYLQKNLYSES